jgi:hypothetical protein
MGDEMLSPGIGNIRGHFEDKEILEFHKSLLNENVINTYIPKKYIKFNQSDILQAKNIISLRNENYPTWGWKDPRSTLLLDLWSECGPEIKFIFMYRKPYEVVSSLCRRIKNFKSPLMLIMPWLGCHSWVHYNKKIINFCHKYPDRSLLISINGFVNNPDAGSEVLQKWLSVSSDKNFSDLFHPEDMKITSSGNRQTMYELYQKTVFRIYSKKMNSIHKTLDALATIPSVDD